MGPLVLALVLASVFLHIGWNLITKGLKPGGAFMFCIAGGGALVALPVLFSQWANLGLVSTPVWTLIGLTGMAQAFYFLSLSNAYKHGDFSLAYPMARALPVFLVAAISMSMDWGRPLSMLAACGMLCIVTGCLLLPLQTFSAWRSLLHNRKSLLFAGLAALGTTTYTLIDYRALQIMAQDEAWTQPYQAVLLYAALESLSSFLWTAVAVLGRRVSRGHLAALQPAQIKLGIGAGMAMVMAYGLILAALSVAEQVSLVVAFRQLSLPIGALIGIRFFKEAASVPRRAGIAVTTLGLVIIALP